MLRLDFPYLRIYITPETDRTRGKDEADVPAQHQEAKEQARVQSQDEHPRGT